MYSRLPGNGPDMPGLRALSPLSPRWRVGGLEIVTINGDIPVADGTRVLWADSIQGNSSEQETGCRAVILRSVASRSWLACSVWPSVGGSQTNA